MKTSIYLAGLMLVAGAAFAAGPPDPAQMEADRAAVFAQADTDGSGGLSLEEFKNFESLMRDKMTQNHFNHLDTNSDGAVSLDELQAGRPGPGGGHGPGHGFGPPPF